MRFRSNNERDDTDSERNMEDNEDDTNNNG